MMKSDARRGDGVQRRQFAGYETAASQPRNLLLCSAVAALFVLAISGYPLVGLVTDWFGFPPRFITAPFRLLVVLLSLAIAVPFLGETRITIPLRLLFLFWFLYFCRVLSNDLLDNIADADTAWQLFIAASIIPAIGMIAGAKFWNDFLSSVLHTAFAAPLLLAILYFGLNFGAEKSVLTDEMGRLAFDSLNPISIAYLAVCLLVSACCVYAYRRTYVSLTMFIVLFLACVYAMDQAASKGPAVAVLAALGFIAVKKRLYIGMALGVVVTFGFIAFYTFSNDSVMFSRVLDMERDNSTIERLGIVEDSINQIIDFPWFGSAFVEFSSGTYPHNQMLEAAMAIGIPCGFFYVILGLYTLSLAFFSEAGDNLFLCALYIVATVNSFFSGAIYGNAMMWLTGALMLSLGSQVRADANVARRVTSLRS